ncbi:MAG: HD domain-containing protein [Candidatus Hodarchaeales archaeon]
MPKESKIVKAFRFAFSKHEGSKRKGLETPYIVHPMDVATILMKNKASEDIIIAGLLHDLIEDEGVSYDDIKEKFSRKVADLVIAVSEPEELKNTKKDPRKTWKQRKNHTIERITKASFDVKLLSCADKLANIRDLYNDYSILGEKLWEKFNAPKEDQKWYYYSMLQGFSEGDGNLHKLPIYKQLDRYIRILFE